MLQKTASISLSFGTIKTWPKNPKTNKIKNGLLWCSMTQYCLMAIKNKKHIFCLTIIRPLGPLNHSQDTIFFYVPLYNFKSYCPSTISNSDDKSGNLNKRINTDWINWIWDIPNDVSLGDQRIEMMVFNEHNEEKPTKIIESKFTVRSQCIEL